MPTVQSLRYKAPTISFLTYSNSNTQAITIPASSQAGDFCILSDMPSNTTGFPVSAVPTGFTGITDYTFDTFGRCRTSYKILVGGDPGASINGMLGQASSRKIIAVFRPSITIASVANSVPNTQGTTGNPAAQIVLANATIFSTIVFGWYRSTASVTTRTFTPAADQELAGSSNLHWGKYKIYNPGTAPADVTVDEADTGSNALESMYFTFSF